MSCMGHITWFFPVVWPKYSPSCPSFMGCRHPHHVPAEMGVLSCYGLTHRTHASACHVIAACILAHIQIGGGRFCTALIKEKIWEQVCQNNLIYPLSHCTSLHKVLLGRKWQDKSLGPHYSEQICGLWISHAHSSIYIYHCWFSAEWFLQKMWQPT